MIDDIDIDINQTKSLFSNNFHQNEEIGHIEHPDGEVTSVSKYKERNKGNRFYNNLMLIYIIII